MRLGWLALALVLYTAFVIYRVMPQLPERIPTHYNWAGHPTAWGSPDVLWTLLIAQVAGTALILAVPAIGRRAPQLVNLGTRRLSDFPPAAREHIMPLLGDMCGWLAVLYCFLFSLLIRDMIRAGFNPRESPSFWIVWAFLAATTVVVVYYLRRFYRIARQVASEEALRSTAQRSPQP
jgi:uncharacterized membrane protein